MPTTALVAATWMPAGTWADEKLTSAARGDEGALQGSLMQATAPESWEALLAQEPGREPQGELGTTCGDDDDAATSGAALPGDPASSSIVTRGRSSGSSGHLYEAKVVRPWTCGLGQHSDARSRAIADQQHRHRPSICRVACSQTHL